MNFYPRSPYGERPVHFDTLSALASISIHALLTESDPKRSRPWRAGQTFLSTLSLRRATSSVRLSLSGSTFLSTLSLRRATFMTFRHCTTYLFLSTLSLRRATQAQSLKIAPLCISIHALLTESDIYQERQCEFYGHFYPRSPYGERPNLRQNQHRRKKFLSTLSLRRATWARGSRVTYVEFLSTLSLRRATFSKETPPHRTHISIHALLTESDFFKRDTPSQNPYFYPRSPYGERQS